MEVLLIQPPDPARPVEPRDSAYGHSQRFVPCWDLLCLRTFLQQRTRHTCHFIDTRFFGNLEKGLTQTLATHNQSRLAAIYATSTGIGQVAAVADILKRLQPQLKVALCGPHPSRFPTQVQVPHIDFAFCGDAEPILRNVVDNLDSVQRLRRVPGLSTPMQDPVEPYWLPDLKSLNLPEWDGVSWPGYRLPPPRQGALAEIQLSRGHTREACDRAVGGVKEPFRIWPFERVATALQKARHAGIVEVFLADPPGFWTGGRLTEWLRALDRTHNTLPWAMQLPPVALSVDLARQLRENFCRRIEFLFPTTETDRWPAYGLKPNLAALEASIQLLQTLGIEVEIRFWVGGPESSSGESAAVMHALRALRFCPFSLQAYPVEFDAPIYRDCDPEVRPQVETWMQWARDPWMAEKPTALWGNAPAAPRINSTMDRIESAVLRSPRRRWLRLLDAIRSMRPIESIQHAALQAVRRRPDSAGY